jgi:hypothetical protein
MGELMSNVRMSGLASSISVRHLDRVDKQSFRDRFLTQLVARSNYLGLLTRGIFPI